MRLHLECYPCLLNQALKTSKLIGLNENNTEAVVNHTMRLLLTDHNGKTAPHITAGIYQFIRGEFYKDNEFFDPYREIKRDTNMRALEYYESLKDMVDCSSSPLQTAVKVAAAGNIIDFGAKEHKVIDIDEEIKNIDNLEFDIFNFSELIEDIKGSKDLLYIGDNSGEIVFDRILISEIIREYPGINIVFAVRGKPIINDVTLEDAEYTGMNDVAEVISSGSIYPGTVLMETNSQFQKIFSSADVIIAKGQGNYETLSDEDKNNLYFLLRIKCDIVAEKIGARTGSLVLWKSC